MKTALTRTASGAPLQVALLVVVVIAASVKSYSLYSSTLDAADLMPQTIASGRALAPNQYRVLVPLLWKGAVGLGIPSGAAERGIVAFSILFCYAALATVLYNASRSVPIAALCLIAFYGAAASGFWFRNRDVFFDVAFTAIGMGLAVQPNPRWIVYALVSMVASLNRETWLFSLIGAAVSRWSDAGSLRLFIARRPRDVFGLAAATGVSIGTLAAVRGVYGVRPYHYALWQYATNLPLFLVAGSSASTIGQAIWFAGSGAFIVWLIFALAGAARYRAFVVGFMGSLLAVSFLISNWWETRIFTPAYAVLIVSISAGLAIKTGADRSGRPSGESRDYAGTYVNRIASSAIKSLATRWSGGRGPAKNGLPPPSTTGRR
jgi:hypothetical protein